MSEIEKMYENAKVEREFAYLECHRGRSSICCPIAEYEKDDECMGCINSSAMEEVYEYPPFTAEKQFFILKFFADNKICGERPIIQFLWDDIGEQYYFYFQVPPDCYHAHDKDYDMALAKVVNLVWTKLTPEQQQKIKEILE